MEKIKYITLLLTLLLFTQCELKYEDFKPLEGEADFSNFVAVGDSYTAGYTDGALGHRGQVNSFSYILSEQLKYVGSEGFNQPLVTSDGSIGTTEIQPGVLNSYFELKLINGDLQPIPGVGDMSILADRLYNESKPFQNFGVPGAKSSHLVAPGYAQFNPFFARFASSNTTSVLQDALAANPTFVSLWIGGNDVLTYALSGGSDDEITNPVLFENYMNLIASNLFGNGAKGVVGNVPAIADLPYFNYILSDGFLPLLIEDVEAPGGIRQLVTGEKVLLSASSYLQAGYGQSLDKPLGGEFILDLNELNSINDAIVVYNKTILSICNQYGLAHVDLNSIMKQVSTKGIFVDGSLYTSTFVSGSVFSLDGIHVTGKGASIIANKFIEAINKTYNSNIPLSNVNQYQSVIFP